MFLEFGNVTAAAISILLLIAVAILVNQVFLFIGKIALSTDNENSPIKLDKNYILTLIWNSRGFSTLVRFPDNTYGVKVGLGMYRDFVSPNFAWSRASRYFADCKTLDIDKAKEHEKFSFWAIPKLLLVCIVTDFCIFWIQNHFLSAIICLGFAGTIMGLRLTTNFLWNNMTKTNEIEKRVETIEEKIND